MKKLFRPLVLGGVLLLAVGLAPVMDTTPARAATVTDANLKQMLEDLMKKYGKNVSLVYKHMPLDEQGPGMLAARYFVAVAAQSESKAWKFYDAMYADRDRLLLEGQKFVDEVCDKLGLDKARLQKDAASDKTARIIAQDLDDAKKLKIDGTPCFLVNGLMVRGALSEPLFEAAVDIALEAAR